MAQTVFANGALRGVHTTRYGAYEAAVMATIVFLVAYVTGTALAAPATLLVALFNVPVALVPVGAWLAWHTLSGRHRRVWLLQALAATCWTVGTLVWYAAFATGGDVAPRNPGIWNVFFLAGYALAVAGMRVGLASATRLTHAVVDTIAIAAALVAFGSMLVEKADAIGWTTRTFVVLARPAFGLLMIVLILSALFGRWETVRPSVLIMALGHVFLTLGSLRGTLDFLANDFADDHWADVLWAAGAACFLVATARVICHRDEQGPGRIAARPGSALWLRLGLTLLLFVGAAQVYRVADRDGGTQVSAYAMTVMGAALALRAVFELREHRTTVVALERELSDARQTGASVKTLRERNMDLRLRQVMIDQAVSREAEDQPEVLDGLMRAVTDLLERTKDPRQDES